jgi:hypothetical protein
MQYEFRLPLIDVTSAELSACRAEPFAPVLRLGGSDIHPARPPAGPWPLGES